MRSSENSGDDPGPERSGRRDDHEPSNSVSAESIVGGSVLYGARPGAAASAEFSRRSRRSCRRSRSDSLPVSRSTNVPTRPRKPVIPLTIDTGTPHPATVPHRVGGTPAGCDGLRIEEREYRVGHRVGALQVQEVPGALDDLDAGVGGRVGGRVTGHLDTDATVVGAVQVENRLPG